MDALLASATEQPEIEGYRTERLIGEGGFGRVWRAIRDDGTPVAIKMLHLELIRSADALTRFERELAAIQRLQHRSVVRGLDYGKLGDGRPYLVLEYIEGPSLRDVIDARGSLPPLEVLDILGPLCDVLATAHEQNLIHRDIKASNVILGRDAEGVRPVLLDFGLVKLTDQEGPGLSSSRAMLGTPSAMAPEQMSGRPVTSRTDIYATGLLAFHMLTGQLAFGNVPGVVQSYLMLHGPRPRPSAKADLDPAIDVPIGRALAGDPAQRYATTREFFAALRDVIAPAPRVAAVGNVIAVYAEGAAEVLARVSSVVATAGMIVAIAAPNSVLAVAPIPAVVVADLVAQLSTIAHASIAIGTTVAEIAGTTVDGEALDVEGWAPYPLAEGLWLAPSLR